MWGVVVGGLGRILGALASVLPWLLLQWQSAKIAKIKDRQLEHAAEPRATPADIVDRMRRNGL